MQQADLLLWTGPAPDCKPFSLPATECKLLTSIISYIIVYFLKTFLHSVKWTNSAPQPSVAWTFEGQMTLIQD